MTPDGSYTYLDGVIAYLEDGGDAEPNSWARAAANEMRSIRDEYLWLKARLAEIREVVNGN